MFSYNEADRKLRMFSNKMTKKKKRKKIVNLIKSAVNGWKLKKIIHRKKKELKVVLMTYVE